MRYTKGYKEAAAAAHLEACRIVDMMADRRDDDLLRRRIRAARKELDKIASWLDAAEAASQ